MVRSAILILNWNGLENTRACLESCPAETRRYVLNNGCRADQRYVPEDARTTLVETPINVGFAAGMNVLIGEAIQDGAEWMLLLNNDARLAGNAFAAMRDAIAPDIAALCPAILDARSGLVWSVGGFVDLWRGSTTSEFHGIDPRNLPAGSMDVDFGSGACLFVSAAAVASIGGLDETYVSYWEETDWCWRARRSGYRIATCPRARVTHEGGASIRASLRAHFLVRNAILFMRRHARPRHWITFVPALGLWSIPTWSARAFVAHPSETVRAIVAAVTWHFRRVKGAETSFATAMNRHDATRSDGQPAAQGLGQVD